MSTIRADNFADRTGAGQVSAAIISQGTAKAWFNLNGTGTIAARDNFNVTSFTDNGTGDYTATFSVAMPNANYSYQFGCGDNVISDAGAARRAATGNTTTAVRNFTQSMSAGTLIDITEFTYSVHGDPA